MSIFGKTSIEKSVYNFTWFLKNQHLATYGVLIMNGMNCLIDFFNVVVTETA